MLIVVEDLVSKSWSRGKQILKRGLEVNSAKDGDNRLLDTKAIGAPHLERAIERLLVYSLSSLFATRQVKLGDVVMIDFDRQTQRLAFFRDRSEVSLAEVALESAGLAERKLAVLLPHGNRL